MDDFPSSVSCVSELVDSESQPLPQPLQQSLPQPLQHSLPQSLQQPLQPFLYPVLLKVVPEFQYRFPGFRPSSPLYHRKPDGTEVITISFLYKEHDIPRFATLVYEVKMIKSNYYSARFNPYASSPQPHQQNGIDWIKLYHIEFEPAIYTLEKAIEEYYRQVNYDC